MLSKELLDVLACPKCKQTVNYDKKKNVLVCVKCGLKYSIKKDIPDMINAKKF